MGVDTKPLNHPSDFEMLVEDTKTRIREVSLDSVAEKISRGDNFHLIAVRDADEFESFRIKSAVFLSKGWVEAKIHMLVDQKDAEIVLYCGSVYRSVLAADNLQRMGYTCVYSMVGGIKGWYNAGYDVEQG